MPSHFKIIFILLLFPAVALGVLFPAEARNSVPGAYSNPFPATDGYPYLGQTIPLSWVDLTPAGGHNATYLPIYDEEFYSNPLPIGFNFPFYDNSFSSFYIHANGFITFHPQSPSADYSVPQCPLPDLTEPNDLLALFWGDLGINKTDRKMDCYYKYFSSCPVGSPIPCLIVEYVDVVFHTTQEKAGTFEAVLYQDGDIIFQYLEVGLKVGQGSNSYAIGLEGNHFAQGYGLTYLCDTANLPTSGTALKFSRNFLSLSPETMSVKGCNGQTANYSYTLTNGTNGAGNFQISCGTSIPGISMSCPAAVFAEKGATVPLALTLTPPACTPPGLKITGTVRASGNGYAVEATLEHTLYQSAIWDQIPPETGYCRQDVVTAAYGNQVWAITGYGANDGVRTYSPNTRLWTPIANSAPPFGQNFAHSGCQHLNSAYMYGDTQTEGFTGLWSYDMDGNSWKNIGPGSYGPSSYPGISTPAWVYDPDAQKCYLTGGGLTASTVGQKLSSVYVFNPVSKIWEPPLAGFTTGRKDHAAFIFTRPIDGHRLLCVAGGLDSAGTPLTSTQCYDFNRGSWNGVNADLGPLPHTWWGMGYAARDQSGSWQLWLIAGILDGVFSNQTTYFNVNSGRWVSGGNTLTGPVSRNSAVTLNNEIFKLGGKLDDLSQICSADQFKVCPSCSEWITDQIFLPLTLR